MRLRPIETEQIRDVGLAWPAALQRAGDPVNEFMLLL
jgi:hypothetical protein